MHLPASKYFVHERGFTRECIAENKGVKVTGRNITERALKVIANYKIALMFFNQYRNQQTEILTPSGMRVEDMLDFVRRKMFVHLKGCKTPGGGRTFQKTEEDIPDKYFFTGYFAFVLFGPMPQSGKTLSCLSEDGSDVARVSRKEARKKKGQVKMAEREADDGAVSSGVYHRGISMKDKASCAHMAQNEVNEAKRNIANLLAINQQEYSNLLKELNQIDQMIDRAELRDRPNKAEEVEYLESQKSELFQSLSDNKKRKIQLEDKSNKLITAKTKPQLKAYYEQVGMFDKRKKKTRRQDSDEEDNNSAISVPDYNEREFNKQQEELLRSGSLAQIERPTQVEGGLLESDDESHSSNDSMLNDTGL